MLAVPPLGGGVGGCTSSNGRCLTGTTSTSLLHAALVLNGQTGELPGLEMVQQIAILPHLARVVVLPLPHVAALVHQPVSFETAGPLPLAAILLGADVAQPPIAPAPEGVGDVIPPILDGVDGAVDDAALPPDGPVVPHLVVPPRRGGQRRHRADEGVQGGGDDEVVRPHVQSALPIATNLARVALQQQE